MKNIEELSSKEWEQLIKQLKTRFEKYMNCHEQIKWEEVGNRRNLNLQRIN